MKKRKAYSHNAERVERYFEKIADTLSLEETFKNYFGFTPKGEEGQLFLGIITLDIISKKVNLKTMQKDILSEFNIYFSENEIKNALFYTIVRRALGFIMKHIKKEQEYINKVKQIIPIYSFEACMLLQAPLSKN